MIHRYVNVNFESSKGKVNKSESTRRITLFYPCTDTIQCAPYTLHLKPAVYSFECWGAKGAPWGSAKPGLGAYTKGTIYISVETTLYVFVGATGVFNSVNTENIGTAICGGGSTDVRFYSSNFWNDTESLKSRIMVAAGGGGAEWTSSIGGNGGDGGTVLPVRAVACRVSQTALIQGHFQKSLTARTNHRLFFCTDYAGQSCPYQQDSR